MTLADATNTIAQEKEETVTKVVEEASTTSEEVKEKPVDEVVEEKEAAQAPVEATTVTVEETVVETVTETVVESTTGTTTETVTEEVVVVETAVVTSEVVEEETDETAMEKETAPEATKEKFEEYFLAGSRFLLTYAFDKAAESLSRAASMGAELFGEGHERTFQANFLYGKALLQLGKVEDEVLTNALTDIPKVADGEEEAQDGLVENPEYVPQEERAKIKHNVEVALGVLTEDAEVIEEEKSEEQTEKTEEAVEDIEMEAVEEQTAEEAVTEDQEESDSEDNDDPMKLSWEILETCRITCVHKLTALESKKNVNAEDVKAWKLNHADVLSSLGEHGIADNKLEQAKKDLNEALIIQTAYLPASSRIRASTNHLLAKVSNMEGLFEKAATYYSDAKDCFIAKVKELKKELETASDKAKTEIESDIKELELMIPAIDALAQDSRASAEQTEKVKESIKQEFESIAANVAKLDGEETKDITSMIRRPTKRSASEEPVEEDAKKRKSGEGVEGAAEETPVASE